MVAVSDPLDPIRQAVRDGALAYSIHAIEEISEEGITFEEIHAAVLGSDTTIIESRVNDPRGESHLVSGRTVGGRPLHIVFGVARQPIKVVTVYWPDLRSEQWEADYRARRRTP